MDSGRDAVVDLVVHLGEGVGLVKGTSFRQIPHTGGIDHVPKKQFVIVSCVNIIVELLITFNLCCMKYSKHYLIQIIISKWCGLKRLLN